MRKAEAAGNDECPVKIKLVAPPLYVLTTQTLDKVLCKPSHECLFDILFLALYPIQIEGN
jgi:translation initiation factor 2 alpha subunit (eIF-2alpha)